MALIHTLTDAQIDTWLQSQIDYRQLGPFATGLLWEQSGGLWRPTLPQGTGGAANVAIVSGGGGGGAATIADGADVALGTKAVAAVTDPTAAATSIALLKGLLSVLGAGEGADNGTFSTAVTALTTVVEINTKGRSVCFVSFDVATADLSQFRVDLTPDTSADYINVASTATHYTDAGTDTPVYGVKPDTDLDLTTATTAVQYAFWCNVDGSALLRIEAAGTASVVAGSWRVK